MIIPDLDRELLYFLKKQDLQVFSLLSKYHNKLTHEDFFPLCYHLLTHQGYKIFFYDDTISLMKKEADCISLNKTPKLLLQKIE